RLPERLLGRSAEREQLVAGGLALLRARAADPRAGGRDASLEPEALALRRRDEMPLVRHVAARRDGLAAPPREARVDGGMVPAAPDDAQEETLGRGAPPDLA